MAALLLRHGAARRLIGGSVVQGAQAAEERRRLLPRRMYMTEKRARKFEEDIAEMLKRHQRDRQLIDDRGNQASRGFDWVQFPLQLAEVGNTVLGAVVLYTIASSCNPLWPFRKDRLEVKDQTDKKQEQ